METLNKEKKNLIIEELLRAGEHEALVAILKKRPAIEVAELLARQGDETLISLLKLFTPEQQGVILSDLEPDLQLKLFHLMDRAAFAEIFSNMASDIRADLYQLLEREDQLQLLPFLDKKNREDVIHLSSYPEETAGSIMSTDFATLLVNMTAEEALNKLRKDAPSKKMIYYLYVVDQNMKMQGFATLKDLIMADPGTPVRDFTRFDYVWADVDEDRESVAAKIEKYDLVAIPVLNRMGQLAGIISHDEAIEVIRAEHTEDMEKFMGIIHDEEDVDYMKTGVFSHFKKRVVWLSSLAVIGLLSGMIIHSFEDAMSALLILALYMPMVADTGGNAGSQAATVVIRALALGQVTIKNWFSILFKEARISLMLSMILGMIAFGKILFLSWETEVPEQFSLFFIASGISFALSLQVISSTIIGAGLPLLVKRLGGDPAVAASPAITTLVDITGLLIYFGIATWLFFG